MDALPPFLPSSDIPGCSILCFVKVFHSRYDVGVEN